MKKEMRLESDVKRLTVPLVGENLPIKIKYTTIEDWAGESPRFVVYAERDYTPVGIGKKKILAALEAEGFIRVSFNEGLIVFEVSKTCHHYDLFRKVVDARHALKLMEAIAEEIANAAIDLNWTGTLAGTAYVMLDSVMAAKKAKGLKVSHRQE